MKEDVTTLDEPLHLIAPLAAKTAAGHCGPDGGAGGTCAWYHGTVDYLRLLDLVISPADHAGFYLPALQRLVAAGKLWRVLISGAGDCCMLAQVLHGVGAAATAPEIVVVDRCETPLRLNRWYAAEVGRAIETVTSPVLDYTSAQPFDAICTHCFLGYFTPQQRPALLAKWFSLLRPGGRVLTVNPIRPLTDHSFVRFTADQAASFEARALAAAAARPERLGDVSLAEFRQRVQGFTASFGSYPVHSIDELRGLFEAAGFIVESIAPLVREQGGGSGPTEPGLPFIAVSAIRP